MFLGVHVKQVFCKYCGLTRQTNIYQPYINGYCWLMSFISFLKYRCVFIYIIMCLNMFSTCRLMEIQMCSKLGTHHQKKLYPAFRSCINLQNQQSSLVWHRYLFLRTFAGNPCLVIFENKIFLFSYYVEQWIFLSIFSGSCGSLL